MSKRMLDLFCGRGGWSKPFAEKGWHCVGVDICFLGYPYEFINKSVLDLDDSYLNSFDAVCMSPPCEDFARAWLPWLRGDKKPHQWALELLHWSVSKADRPGRIVECSNFSARHCEGSMRVGSYSFWVDVPLLFPQFPRIKSSKWGARPDLRSEIPPALSDTVFKWFERGIQLREAQA